MIENRRNNTEITQVAVVYRASYLHYRGDKTSVKINQTGLPQKRTFALSLGLLFTSCKVNRKLKHSLLLPPIVQKASNFFFKLSPSYLEHKKTMNFSMEGNWNDCRAFFLHFLRAKFCLSLLTVNQTKPCKHQAIGQGSNLYLRPSVVFS